VLTHEGDSFTGGHAVQHGKTGEGSTRPAATAFAGDLHSFVFGSTPRLMQRVSCVVRVSG